MSEIKETPARTRRMNAQLHALQLRAAAALRAWRDAPPGEGVAEMREAANCMLDAREQFQTSDGATDWTGRSTEYRQFHRGVINLAAKDSTEAKAMQNTLRWHVQHQRAKRLTRDELRSIGLRPDTPNERAVARDREAARAQALSGPGRLARPLPTRDEIIRIAQEACREFLVQVLGRAASEGACACKTCGKAWPVASLARDCEDRHLPPAT